APRPRHRRCRHHRRRGRPPPARRPRVRGPRLRPARRARVDARGLRGPHGRPAPARGGAQGDRGLHARHPPGGDRRRDRELPQAPPHAHRGQQRPVQRGGAGGARRVGRALHLRELLDGVRARRAVPDARGPPARLPRPRVGVRVLQAHGRGLHARGARRARPAVHDLPPLQRLRPGRDADGRAGDRPRRPGPHPQVLHRPHAAGDLRRRHPDPHAHPRRRHRRRDRGRHRFAEGAQRGLQHLGVRRAHRRGDRRDLLARRRERPGRLRARAPPVLPGRRPPPVALGREGGEAAGLEGADRRRGGHRRDRALAASTGRGDAGM
ncbi:MAG: UDP-glucose 4-epimerase, partial [uncultured Solirubrobacteraceae bacterium]